jgi:Transposase IS116/IS110/IS902 family
MKPLPAMPDGERKHMTTTTRTALHKFREEGELVFLLSNGIEVETKNEKQFASFVKKLPKGVQIISTSANPSDAILATLAEKGAKIFSAHWHSTGIAKNLSAQEIVMRFAQLDDSVLKPVLVRKDIIELRNTVNVRETMIEYRKKAQLKLSAVSRNAGGMEKPAYVKQAEEELEAEWTPQETSIDKEVIAIAKKIPECVVLHEIMGNKNAWLSAAAIVARVQDVRRFPMPSSLWHYAGLHGTVKRTKGQANDWNSKLKTALYLWASASLRGGDRCPSFRQPYDQYRAAERAIHETKCKCKTPDGHSTMRAMRRVEKDLLLNFWVRMNKFWEEKEAA